MALGRPATEELLICLGHPLKITSPPALRLGGFAFQVLLGICLKGVAAALSAEPVTVPLIDGYQTGPAGLHLHSAYWINISRGGG